MTRTVRLIAAPVPLALSVSAVLLLSACGNVPLRAGAAAIVGDSSISTTALQQVVDRGLADPQAQQQLGADRVAFQRQVLSRLITGDLLATAASANGVSVSPGEVDARLAEFATQLGGRQQLETQAAQSGIAAPDLRRFVHDLTLNDKLGDDLVKGQVVPAAQLRSLYQQNIAMFDQVVARHILLKTAAEAQQVLAQVKADPPTFAAIAAARSLDEGSKARGGELDPAGRGAYVAEFEKALFSAKPGQYGIVQTQFGFHVYNVLERRTTTLAQATPQLRRQALQAPREAAITSVLQKTARAQEVRVNPRFGRFDTQTVTVVDAAAKGPGVVSSPAAGNGPAAPVAPLGAEQAPQQGADGSVPQEQAPQQAPQEQAPQEQAPQQAPAPPAS